jgi:hypothetical protein
MTKEKDANYQHLINEIRGVLAEAAQHGRTADDCRNRARNATGTDVRSAQAEQNRAQEAQSAAINRSEALMNRVISVYGGGHHAWR